MINNFSKGVFKVVGLIGRTSASASTDIAQVKHTLAQVVEWLEPRGIKVLLEKQTSRLLPDYGLQSSQIKCLGETCDLVIVVGGDGCLLGAGRALAKFAIPILGVNLGRLGFLTDVLPSELSISLEQIFSGKHYIEHRFLLEAEIKHNASRIGVGDALNDVVVHPGQGVHMIEFELYVEGSLVFRQRSDGLIVATPTGSTAYALSAGGPMIYPTLDVIAIVPICPHTLSNRPLVVHANSEIKILFVETGGVTPHVSCDGQTGMQISSSDVLYVRRKPRRMQLIHSPDYDYYAACRAKLGWAAHLTPL